jgi:hypothetical protein
VRCERRIRDGEWVRDCPVAVIQGRLYMFCLEEHNEVGRFEQILELIYGDKIKCGRGYGTVGCQRTVGD